ncbi:hypothetical protein, partial [Pseudoalteromonas maricaloris]|uniref:hypothetical protein n=2 Tax=Pseudoalteromonas TaxID=53246 RepID=UPI000299DC7A
STLLISATVMSLAPQANQTSLTKEQILNEQLREQNMAMEYKAQLQEDLSKYETQESCNPHPRCKIRPATSVEDSVGNNYDLNRILNNRNN